MIQTFYFISTYILCGIFFLSIGSCLNAIIYRLPQMMQEEDKKKKSLNLFFPRSFCPTCKKPIPYRFNIPLLGYFCLHGRCYHCHASISWQYPIVEALTLILSMFALLTIGINTSLIVVLLFIWLLILLCFIDLNEQLLPDSLTLGLLWMGLIANTVGTFTSLEAAVYGAVFGYLSLWIFTQLFYLMTGKIGMGNGDFKLFAGLGAFFGATTLPLIILIASALGALFGGIYLYYTKQNKNTPIPFGPFLCIAGLVFLFYRGG